MSLPKIKNYEDIVGEQVINNILSSASPLSEKEVLHVNSTFFGGGVAEILNTLVLLMSDAGMKGMWRILKASTDFFHVTKEIHNGLQGGIIDWTEDKRNIYSEYNERNAKMNIVEEDDQDIVVIHDPQPLPIIKFYEKIKDGQKWIWRCHIDITEPNKILWKDIVPLINKYNRAIFSHQDYLKKEIKIPQVLIHPSIDPLSKKNMELSDKKMNKILSDNGVDLNKPIITQISRFDKWKDPIGVIDAYKIIRKKVNCKLILLGNMADDDPEGPEMLKKMEHAVKHDGDIHIITNADDDVVNAVQRASSVIFQKSLKEGFALTISEALWKGVPVIGTRHGGIPLQVIDGKTGFLIDSIQEAADRCIKLLKDDKLREEMGNNAREHVRQNFLITRHLQDYINLFIDVLK